MSLVLVIPEGLVANALGDLWDWVVDVFVRIGDISSVDYESGHAVVTMAIDRKFLPVYKNATILLRPKTGLKDMFLELDPGTNYDPDSNDDEFQNGGTISVGNTAPDTNVDQVLADGARTSGSCSAASGRSTAAWPG